MASSPKTMEVGLDQASAVASVPSRRQPYR